ncbi:alkaline phosphatase D family protein [Pontibacter sp. G13]|uniref:alkaline phosphatase D family protein n=1 Tax=Pontibacter sp. G13 TaxID=3074898 RepID=UPI00288C05DD|nr:alkaline phosphatase D family protein [Pontibacter sp. G13]WNJ18164.1 alkaline phosphatase D family protein [Pontibacter sp. G13]
MNSLLTSPLAWLVSVLMTVGCAGEHTSATQNSLYHKAANFTTVPPEPEMISRISFGSCAHQDKDQPVLRHVVGHEPDLFIYLGDNIYGDSEDMDVLREKYMKLGMKPEFQALRAECPVIATWDDHDFGQNDGGRHYPMKEESREIFLDFWGEPIYSERRRHDGIYHSMMLQEGGHSLQIILLDTRTFRDDLIENDDREYWKNDYKPNPSKDSTFLGDAQWKWLKAQFQQPAELRIIASSNQFAHEYNGYESWTNVPHEQQKMLDLIKETQASGVVFLSGDVHWGEISKRPVKDQYPIYDITSSGITQTWPHFEENKYRLGRVVEDNNFGILEIDWKKNDPIITMQLWDERNTKKAETSFSLSEISFPAVMVKH